MNDDVVVKSIKQAYQKRRPWRRGDKPHPYRCAVRLTNTTPTTIGAKWTRISVRSAPWTREPLALHQLDTLAVKKARGRQTHPGKRGRP